MAGCLRSVHTKNAWVNLDETKHGECESTATPGRSRQAERHRADPNRELSRDGTL